ncbi:hypothetical protein [Massilia yuzhufengensis]|uniref:DUF7931 domain-containing protein n=1 Tax=Massilia yuzhufengensis TaxID=1164594 RepID=A0A1I1V818_9BURK|nr:hypothetical protein [Massilia yuzhufengensis]SFD79019.1 hypothetical protein SAMN05216204_1385 [Massilia yuzhufengensis]
MQEPVTTRFDSLAGFGAQLRACLAAARARIDLFDPDCAVFALGATDVDAALRAFLKGGGVLRVAMHTPAHIERHFPRFQRLLRDYSHGVACRATPRALHGLTDSFCIVDDVHVLRRFHSDHMRGEAAFASPGAVDLPRHRFDAIWEESAVTLQPTTTGL